MAQTYSKKDLLEKTRKPLYTLNDKELKLILDNWFKRSDDKLVNQRKIWDYSYLAYKGIMLNQEINSKRSKSGYNMYVNVPRTFQTVEGVRKYINLNPLHYYVGGETNTASRTSKTIFNLLNADIERSGTKDELKDAGFDMTLYGNGYMYSFLLDKKHKWGWQESKINKDGRCKVRFDKEENQDYFGLTSQRKDVYDVFPDPDCVTYDVRKVNQPVGQYVCLRTVKHYNQFIDDWMGIVDEKQLLDKVKPGGLNMMNYRYMHEVLDTVFDYDTLKYSQNNSWNNTQFVDMVKKRAVNKFDYNEFVEERLWIGRDFVILQAGEGGEIVFAIPNPSPSKDFPITKLDNVSIPGKYFGIGYPEMLRYQQIEENRVHNYVLDALYYSISNIFGVNTSYLAEPDDLEMHPGKILKFKPLLTGVKMSDVISSFSPDISGIAPSMGFLEKIKQDGQSTTSITDLVIGASKSIADTATEAKGLMGASNLSITEKMREVAEKALRDIGYKFIDRYSLAYKDKDFQRHFETANGDQKIVFVGTTREKTPIKKIEKLLENGYNKENIIFLDDLSRKKYKLKIEGDIEVSGDLKIQQWMNAIGVANKINEQAFNSGDPRRIDTISMGLEAMKNFTVISNPDKFLMENMPTKTDEMTKLKEAGVSTPGAGQGEGGGRPGVTKQFRQESAKQNSQSTAQPNFRGQNKLTGKNEPSL